MWMVAAREPSWPRAVLLQVEAQKPVRWRSIVEAVHNAVSKAREEREVEADVLSNADGVDSAGGRGEQLWHQVPASVDRADALEVRMRELDGCGFGAHQLIVDRWRRGYVLSGEDRRVGADEKHGTNERDGAPCKRLAHVLKKSQEPAAGGRLTRLGMYTCPAG